MESHYSFIREYLGECALVRAEWEYLDLLLHIAGAELPDTEYEALDRFRRRIEELRLRTVRQHYDVTDAMLDLGSVDASLLRCLAELRRLLARGSFDLHDQHRGRVAGLIGSDFADVLEQRANDYEKLARDLLDCPKRFLPGDGPRRLRGIVAGPSIYGKGKGGNDPKGQGKPDTPPRPNP